MGISTILDVGEAMFTALALTVGAGVSAHICFGYGTRKWKDSFIGLICALILAVQVYYVVIFGISSDSEKILSVIPPHNRCTAFTDLPIHIQCKCVK